MKFIHRQLQSSEAFEELSGSEQATRREPWDGRFPLSAADSCYEGPMKTVRNLTHKPIKVPLPRGKSLRLGPNNDGTIRDRAAEHPALLRMVEAGTIEIFDGTTAGPNLRGGKL